MVTAPTLTAQLTEEFARGSHVVADLSGVPFFGVSGLVTLLEAGEAAERKDKVLAVTTGSRHSRS
ncbi:STAS domain-containing protein [Saccharothrix sp. AJ9571]|nr:STAS domain-containing protein [Saccharothrix sp. AJ9571]